MLGSRRRCATSTAAAPRATASATKLLAVSARAGARHEEIARLDAPRVVVHAGDDARRRAHVDAATAPGISRTRSRASARRRRARGATARAEASGVSVMSAARRRASRSALRGHAARRRLLPREPPRAFDARREAERRPPSSPLRASASRRDRARALRRLASAPTGVTTAGVAGRAGALPRRGRR